MDPVARNHAHPIQDQKKKSPITNWHPDDLEALAVIFNLIHNKYAPTSQAYPSTFNNLLINSLTQIKKITNHKINKRRSTYSCFQPYI